MLFMWQCANHGVTDSDCAPTTVWLRDWAPTRTVTYLGGMRPWPPLGTSENIFWWYTVKNGISNLYILLKSALKMQEMPFQRPKFQKNVFFGGGGHAPGSP